MKLKVEKTCNEATRKDVACNVSTKHQNHWKWI